MSTRSLLNESGQRSVSRESPSIVLSSGETICGKVTRFGISLKGEITGFILDRGLHVRFPSNQSQEVGEILSIGSSVSVDGCMGVSDFGDDYLDAITITSLDSIRSIEFEGAPLPQPTVVTLVTSSAGDALASPPPFTSSDHGSPQHTTSLGNDTSRATGGLRFPPAGLGTSVASVILQQALNALHHTEALLVYLLAVKTERPDLAHRIFFESVHAYEQAQSKASERDFAKAEHFAFASRFLSRATEILILRAIQLDGKSRICKPSLQRPVEEINAATLAQAQLQRVDGLLSSIRLMMERGTLQASYRIQLGKLISLGEALYGHARCFCVTGEIKDTIEFAHAAEAVANSAEHLHSIGCLEQGAEESCRLAHCT